MKLKAVGKEYQVGHTKFWEESKDKEYWGCGKISSGIFYQCSVSDQDPEDPGLCSHLDPDP